MNMHDSFRFSPLRSNQVRSALEKLNVRKASDYDSITPNMLKLTSSSITDSLTKLHNKRKGNGQKHGRKANEILSLKRMTD